MDREKILEMHNRGMTCADIGKEIGVSGVTIAKRLKSYGVDFRPITTLSLNTELQKKAIELYENRTLSEVGEMMGISAYAVRKLIEKGGGEVRSRKYSPQLVEELGNLYFNGHTAKEISEMYDISIGKLMNLFRGHGWIGKPRGVAVVKLSFKGEYIDEYESISDASKENGISEELIRKCINGKVYKAGNYKWMKMKEYLQNFSADENTKQKIV